MRPASRDKIRPVDGGSCAGRRAYPLGQAANGTARRARRAKDSRPRRTAVGSGRAAFASPGTGRNKGPPRWFLRPVPGLRRDRLSPSAGALGYYLSPYGLGRMKIVAAREGRKVREHDTWQRRQGTPFQCWRRQAGYTLSLIHISEPTRQAEISYAVFCLKK